MSEYQYISREDADGLVIGYDANDLISFHGAAPCDQAAHITDVDATSHATGLVGFSTTAIAVIYAAAINSIITLLKEKGITA